MEELLIRVTASKIDPNGFIGDLELRYPGARFEVVEKPPACKNCNDEGWLKQEGVKMKMNCTQCEAWKINK